MEPVAALTNDNNDLSSDQPSVPDQQPSSENPNTPPDADKSSDVPKARSTAPNGPAKRGIAAAIAAFEKGTGEKTASPKASPAAIMRSTPAVSHSKEPSHPTNNDTTANQTSVVKPAPAIKKEPTTAVKKSEPVPANKAHPRTSTTTTTTTTTTTKPSARAAASTRPAPGRTATKPSATTAASPPVGAASRRTSIISTATRVPPKTTTTSAVAAAATARKLPLNNTASTGLRNAQSTLAPGRKLSTAPSATIGKTAAAKPAANASSQATAELESKLSQAELKLATQSEELATLQARSAASLDTIKSELETAKARVVELEGVVELHQKERADLDNRHQESSAEVARLTESVNGLKQQLDEVIASKQAAIDEASSHHLNQLESKLDEARVEFEAQKSALESRLEELERQSKHAQSEAATQAEAALSAELAKKTEEVSQKHSEELEQLSTQHASQIENLTREQESAVQRLREDLEAKIAAAEKAFADMQEETASSDAARKEENAHELANAVEQARSTVKTDFESSIATLKEEHVSTLAKLETEITEIKEAKLVMKNELDELMSRSQAFTAEKQALEERLSSDTEALKTEHALQLEQEYQRAKDELNEAHIDQLKSFRQTSQESTEQLLQSHRAELEAVRSALLSDFASEKATLEAGLEQAKLELSALHSDLSSTQKSKQEQSDQINRLTVDLGAARAILTNLEAKANEPVKSEELEELQKVLQKTQQDAEEQRLLLEKNQQELVANFEHARELHSGETAKHIEEKTLLQKELSSFKERLESGDERIKMSQALVEELSQTIEQEMCKKEELEAQLKNLQKSPGSKAGDATSHNTNLIELHEAHNLKILELTNEVEKWKDIAAKKEEEADEKQFRIKLLEEMIEKDDDDEDDEDKKSRSKEEDDKQELLNLNSTLVNKREIDDDDEQHQEDLDHHSKIQAEESPANNYSQDLSIKFVS
ncbi:hypothetical protein PTTG_08650 [Puccinia triticina 1-1 BBBD Race 1]|uniref:Uncharacterized protein n=1 Tax=Puccinia triticina (isolate 1-1 / race 1 (BBBD)) TaxID=630390 RepID=A0A0C4F686_PUCT1|nr:hypothetical protein PTTG_08650 [Puccinia triticina 1-1 BBBD Race 1]